MKTLRVVLCALILFVTLGMLGDGPHYRAWRAQQPRVIGGPKPMGLWKLIKPESTTNHINNPSFEDDVTTAWNFAQSGSGAARTQNTDSFFGAYSCRIEASDSGSAFMYTKTADNPTIADGESVTLTAYCKSQGGEFGQITIYDATNSTARVSTASVIADRNHWTRLEATWTNDTGGDVEIRSYLYNTAGNGASLVFYDGAQLEQKSYATTYCDGDQPGCDWSGEAHNSTSVRDADAWQGGRIYDLADDYGFVVQTVTGADAPPVEVFGTPFAARAGETADGERIMARDLFLIGEIYSNTSWADFQQKKAAFFDELKHWRAGQAGRANSDPLKLRYAGTARTVEIDVKYMGGFEGTHSARDGWSQRFTLHFRAQEDVWWHSINRLAAVLDEEDSATVRYVMAKIDGGIDVLGPPSSGGPVYALAYDGINLYVGTADTSWDGITDADYFVRWNGSSWEKLGPSALNGNVKDIEVLPDGDLLIGGGFTNAGGDADADYCVIYDKSADDYTALGSGPGEAIQKVAIDPTTGLYYAMSTTDVYEYDGSSWSSLSMTGFEVARDMTFAPDGTLYVGGQRDTGGTNYVLLKSYDGSTWTTILGSTTSEDAIYGVVSLSDGRIAIGGSFSDLDGTTVYGVGLWNGQYFEQAGDGLEPDHIAFATYVDPDDAIWAGGYFETADDVAVKGFAVFNGSVWLNPGFEAPTALVEAMEFDGEDVYIAGSFGGTGHWFGDTTISTTGGRPIAPRFRIKRSGGTSATLYYIENVDTGSEMFFDLDILDGEEITIDLQARTITSDFGRKITGQPLPGSPGLGEFDMQESSNEINLWVDSAGSPTITALMDYYVQYDGWAGGDVD